WWQRRHIGYVLAVACNQPSQSRAAQRRSNVSHFPAAVRLAISGLAPPLSAVTIFLLAFASSTIDPSPTSKRKNASQAPASPRLAISGLAPAFSAVTISSFAWDRRAIH